MGLNSIFYPEINRCDCYKEKGKKKRNDLPLSQSESSLCVPHSHPISGALLHQESPQLDHI